jgi:branched-subunit amino acid transport protein
VPQRIARFSVAQTAKVAGALYGLMGLVFVPFFLLAAMFSPKAAGPGVGLALALPFFYALGGFIATAIACVLYNWVAGMIGGIEVELES